MRPTDRIATTRLSLLLAIGAAACAGRPDIVPAATTAPESIAPVEDGIETIAELDDLSVPPLPIWVDRYWELNVGDMRFFNIGKLMASYGLERHEAVELQNHYRDQSRAAPDGDRVAQFNEALARVRRGDYESGIDPADLAQAEFIVVFDLDETMYDQYHASADCADVTYDLPDGKKKYIELTPGWDDAIRKIHGLGGRVVLFSANQDAVNYANFAHWKLDGVPLNDSPLVAAVMTNSYLIRQERTEGAGAKSPLKGQPVIEASKDLRIFDPSLERVIIVDDNPTRLFQLRNTRVFKKFHANEYCGDDAALKKAFEGAMPEVIAEIEDSVQYMRDHKRPFAIAYRPFTALGRHAVDALIGANGWTRAQAIDHVRTHPDIVERKY